MSDIALLEDKFYIIAAGIDGFLLGQESRFTSVDDQAGQLIGYVKEHLNGHLDAAYGLSLGGKNHRVAGIAEQAFKAVS